MVAAAVSLVFYVDSVSDTLVFTFSGSLSVKRAYFNVLKDLLSLIPFSLYSASLEPLTFALIIAIFLTVVLKGSFLLRFIVFDLCDFYCPRLFCCLTLEVSGSTYRSTTLSNTALSYSSSLILMASSGSVSLKSSWFLFFCHS